jgi:acyl-CoA synthetase (AMP-forming)/AMP-acid ligase II
VLAQTVTEAAKRFGSRPVLVDATGWALSYADLHRTSDEVAAGLSRRGIGDGTVVALVLPAIPEYVVLYVALAKLGATTAGINHRLTTSERQAALTVADADFVIATEELAPNDDALCVVPAAGGDRLLAELREQGGGPPPLAYDPDRPVAIIFTSGTTGTPKGAVFCGRQIEFICGVDTRGVWADASAAPSHSLSGSSLTHLGPVTKLAGNLHRGGTTHLIARWDARVALQMTERFRMTTMAGVPTQLALMLREPRLEAFDLSSLRTVVIGGGPATPALVREARERLAVSVSIRYSCTEAGTGVGTTSDDPLEDAEESVGRAHDGVHLSIRAANGSAMPTGEVGEVSLRSPAVMSGYHRDVEATAAAFWADGFLRTGDLGFLDERGRLHLVGRAKEMYVRGGNNVYPMEVEAVLSLHPDVEAVAVVPRPDDVMGEVGVAVVVPRNAAAPPGLDALRAFAAERIARHKLPETLRLVDALPLTAASKLDRRALRDMV